MKTAPRFSAHVMAALVAASPLVYSTINPAIAQDRFADVEVKATAIKGSVHMLTGAGGNIGVSAGEDGVLIIDDQFAPLAEKIAAQLGELGSDKPKYVINTHYHGDHTGSNAFFHSHKGATILAHENGTALPDGHHINSIEEGMAGMRFIDACQRSSKNDASWVSL